jgi:23S rRNA (guanosine2251-2'-O)-methyltransferase
VHSGPKKQGPSPRDVFITVYGRKPVLEALDNPALTVAKVHVADNAHGDTVDAILRAAGDADLEVERTSAQRVKLLAGNGRHDQGVVADVVAPRMQPLEDFLRRTRRHARGDTHPGRKPQTTAVLVLDAITNPSNVGMILRTATAAGLDGVVLPHSGTPEVGPLVIKASAGVAFRAPILRCTTAAQAAHLLRQAGFVVYGLAGTGDAPLYDAELAPMAAFVLGNETRGVTPEVRRQVEQWLSIPLFGGVESLNVASAAAVVAYELVRRRPR